ncbi:hypothetical protein ACE41A_15455 [Bacillus cytotoxicus]
MYCYNYVRIQEKTNHLFPKEYRK